MRQQMRAALWASALVLAAGPGGTAQERVTVTFEQDAPGKLPPAFLSMASGGVAAGEWRVGRIGGQRAVLTQSTTGGAGYRLAVLQKEVPRDLRIGIGVRPDEAGDRTCGVAWQVRDAANYYAARLDLEDGEFMLHKFVNGNRVRLSRIDGLRLDPEGWHEIVVQHAGDKIRAWLNGIPVASERDSTLRDGRVALWMPADSSCHFDRLWYERVRRH